LSPVQKAKFPKAVHAATRLKAMEINSCSTFLPTPRLTIYQHPLVDVEEREWSENFDQSTEFNCRAAEEEAKSSSASF
jgi:hypothetical protein